MWLLGATRLPREQLTVADAVAAHTIAGAWQDFLDGETGSLELGKRADFIVLDRNLFEVPLADIHRARVLWTVVEGQEVYRAENWDERSGDKVQERSTIDPLNGASANSRRL